MIDAAALLLLLAAGRPLVAVMPPVAPSAMDDADTAAAVSEAQQIISGALVRLGSVQRLDARALTQLINSAATSGIGCDAAQPECAARIGAFGGLDFVIVTRFEREVLAPGGAGAQLRATLALYDCVDGREVRRAGALLAKQPATRRQGLAELALAILGEGEARGQLLVRASAAGDVIVDGVARGPAPLTIPIAAGGHEVSWRAAGGELTTVLVEVPAAGIGVATFGPTVPQSALPPNVDASAESTAPSLVVLAGGALAVGAVVAVVGGLSALVVAPVSDERARYTAREYNDAVALGRGLFGACIAGAVFAALAGGALVIAMDVSSPVDEGAAL